MTTTSSAREREAKLAAWAGFRLPDLADVAEGVAAVPLHPRTLDATYYDTPDLRLARAGITVRHRTGDAAPVGDGAEPEGVWTVKLPEGQAGPALARREVTVAGPPRVVPDQVGALVRAHVRSAHLRPVARLVTRRRPVELRGAGGERLGEVADDEVSVMDGRRLALRFREVEVELDPGAAGADDSSVAVLDSVVARLREAGAGAPEPTPKVVRALGPRALEPADVSTVELGPSSPAADLVRAALADGTGRLLRHDPGVRLGDDPEDVHQARVAARRLRSDLRTFRSLLDPEASAPLSDELRWLGGELGAVRDADVLLERLRTQAAELAEADRPAADALLARLEGERAAARERLLEALDGDRYLDLLESLVAAATDPPCLPDAERPARKVCPRLVARPWAHVSSAVDALGEDPALEELHQVRIRAKRCRYAAEAAAPVAGKPARRLARALAGLQGVLGDLNDAVVAQAWLRQVAQGLPPAEALVAGELAGRQWLDIDKGRRSWRSAWDEASAASLRTWLR